jgi:aspartate/methionine/tyrosine aminotransferase
MRLTSRTLQLAPSPISSAQALVREYTGEKPIFDCSQGVPHYPTSPEIAARIAAVAISPEGGRYTARAGIEALRVALADELSAAYEGTIRPNQVLITAGCNQAFCTTLSALAEPGDSVIVVEPFYFNHDMWLRLDGIRPAYLRCEPGFVPDASAAEALISPRTRAIVLVTPGNPTGVAIPPAVIDDFVDLAMGRGVMLVLDETYRVFRDDPGRPHAVFSNDRWDEAVVSLHSFSKEFAIPGHRVGAVVGHPDLIGEALKLLECVAVCAPRLGQEAVMEGLRSSTQWRRTRAMEMRDKLESFRRGFAQSPGGFSLAASGAFFGWVQQPASSQSSEETVRRLVVDSGILALPGTLFTRRDEGYLRFSFANLSLVEIDELANRLQAWQ